MSPLAKYCFYKISLKDEELFVWKMLLSTHLFKVKITIAIQSWHLHSRACAKVTCHVVQKNQEASKLPYLYELLGLKVSFVWNKILTGGNKTLHCLRSLLGRVSILKYSMHPRFTRSLYFIFIFKVLALLWRFAAFLWCCAVYFWERFIFGRG